MIMTRRCSTEKIQYSVLMLTSPTLESDYAWVTYFMEADQEADIDKVTCFFHQMKLQPHIEPPYL